MRGREVRQKEKRGEERREEENREEEGMGKGRSEERRGGEENLLVFTQGLCSCESCSVSRADYPERGSSLWGPNGPRRRVRTS